MKILQQKNNSKDKMGNNNSGFTLLIGLLVAGILLVIGLSIFSISQKQLELTTDARNSQTALYNAESGVECALYSDLRNSDSQCSTQDDISPISGTCAIGPPVLSFSMHINDVNSQEVGCADVLVCSDGSGNKTITSDGFNTCDSNDPNQVQRELYVTY